MPSGGKTEHSQQSTDPVESSSRRSRRRFLAGAAGSAASIALAGCTGGGDTKSGGAKDVKAAKSIKVAAVSGEGDLFQRLVKDYVEEDTGVTVKVSKFPYANLFEKTNSVLGTKGTAYDILFMDDPWFPQFAFHCEPLEQWVPQSLPKDKIIQNCIDIGTWPAPEGPTVPSAKGMNEEIRGQVVVGNAQLFVYNKKYYEQVGAKTPPKTWDDVLSAGKKISQQIDGANGYIIRGKRGNPINANFFSLGMSKAGDMFDKSWKYKWDEQQGIDALKFYVNDLKSISPDGVTAFDSDQVLSNVGDGTAAQSPAWPAAASLLLDSSKAKEAKNLQFTMIPKGSRRAPEQGNWIAGINKYISDEKKKAAGTVISSFISKKAQNKYVELGGVPFRRDTFEDNMDAQPWFNALYKSLQNAKWRPRTPLWNQIAVSQGKYLNSALTGSVAPKEALSKVNDEVEKMLDESGYYKS